MAEQTSRPDLATQTRRVIPLAQQIFWHVSQWEWRIWFAFFSFCVLVLVLIATVRIFVPNFFNNNNDWSVMLYSYIGLTTIATMPFFFRMIFGELPVTYLLERLIERFVETYASEARSRIAAVMESVES